MAVLGAGLAGAGVWLGGRQGGTEKAVRRAGVGELPVMVVRELRPSRVGEVEIPRLHLYNLKVLEVKAEGERAEITLGYQDAEGRARAVRFAVFRYLMVGDRFYPVAELEQVLAAGVRVTASLSVAVDGRLRAEELRDWVRENWERRGEGEMGRMAAEAVGEFGEKTTSVEAVRRILAGEEGTGEAAVFGSEVRLGKVSVLEEGE